MKPAYVIAPIVLACVGWLASGIVTVDSGDVAVVFRFGAVHRAMKPGINVRLPWPVESHEVVQVTGVRRLEPGTQRMLTGDTNLIELDLVVQYTVADAIDYQLGFAMPDQTLSDTVLAVASDVIATMGVDSLLTTGRTLLEQRVAEQAQALMAQHHAGLRIAAVEVRELTPPSSVVDAFNDVSSARGDRETLSLAAEAYASKLLPSSRGQAASMTESARAEGATLTARAAGDVEYFQTLLPINRQSTRSLRSRLMAETLERIGARVQLHGVRKGTEVFLPGLESVP